jgi:hypothetical protein
VASDSRPKPEIGYDLLVHRSLEELRAKTAAHDGTWQLSQADWDLDLDGRTITFTSPTGIRAMCSVQIIGTYNTTDGTWLWAWDHPSVDFELAEHARMVRKYGELYGIEKLTTRKVACTEAEAWEFTAVACSLGGAEGGYRGPDGSTLVFVTFSDVELTRA